MASFDEFYKSFKSDTKGKIFEKFVKWFLKNEPMWKKIVDEVWLWDEYPDKKTHDIVTDLVFRDKQGRIMGSPSKRLQ